jgi:hypothetical protein
MLNALQSIIHRRPRPKTARKMQSMARKMLIDMLDSDEPIRNHEDWNWDIELTWEALEVLGYVSRAEEEEEEEEEDDHLELVLKPEFDRLILQAVWNWNAKLRGRRLTRLTAYLKKRCVRESDWKQSGALMTIPSPDHASDVSMGVDVSKLIFCTMNLSFDGIDVDNWVGYWNEHCAGTVRRHFDTIRFVDEVLGLLGLMLKVRDEDDELTWQPTPELLKRVQAACESHISAQKAECWESLKLSYECGFIDKDYRDDQISKYDEVWNGLLGNLKASLNPR